MRRRKVCSSLVVILAVIGPSFFAPASAAAPTGPGIVTVEGTASRYTDAGVVKNCTWIEFTVGVLHGPRSPEAIPYSAAGKVDVTVRWLDANSALLVRSEQTAWVAPRFSIAGTNPCVVVPSTTRKVELTATMYRWSNRAGWVQIDTASVPVTPIPAPSTWPLDDPYRAAQLFTYTDAEA